MPSYALFRFQFLITLSLVMSVTMTHKDLQTLLKHAFSVKLLASPNAPLILSFLHRQFKHAGCLTISHEALSAALEQLLVELRQHHPERYPGTVSHYLSQWCDEEHRFLRKYYVAGSDDPVYELTSASERALGWVADLHKSAFVGTESRFLRIMALLKDMVVHQTDDVALRLRQLQAQQAALQAQIDTLASTGRAVRYSDTQLKERFLEAHDIARRLLGDFREVEENFRAIARSVQEQLFQTGNRKGDILRYVLDADAALKTSDQGRSFYAFWQFLLSQDEQEELRQLLDTIYAMPGLPTDQEMGLRHLKRQLLDAGAKVVASNRSLIQQLRTMLDEHHAADAQRVRDLITEISQVALRVVEAPPDDEAFMAVETSPTVDSPMARVLWSPPPVTSFGDEPPELGEADLSEATLDAFQHQLYVDERLLRQNIAHLLEYRPAVTLAEVVKTYPIERGLTEVITYFSIAAKGGTHTIDTTIQDTILVRQNVERRNIILPRIVFARGEA